MNSKQISWHDFFIEIDILSQVHVVVTYSIQSIGHFQNLKRYTFKSSDIKVSSLQQFSFSTRRETSSATQQESAEHGISQSI